MRFSALYTCVTLKGSYYGKGHNSTSVLSSRIITTNTKCLYLRHPPSLQLVDIPSASQIADIPFTSQIVDIPSTNQTADIPSTS